MATVEKWPFRPVPASTLFDATTFSNKALATISARSFVLVDVLYPFIRHDCWTS
jgi:hypothetical protein